MFDVMVGINTAVANAKEFAKNVLDANRAVDPRLEEIDSSDVNGKAVWLVTLSIPHSNPLRAIALTASIGADSSREYRVFTVLKENGEVLSMKIRLFAAA